MTINHSENMSGSVKQNILQSVFFREFPQHTNKYAIKTVLHAYVNVENYGLTKIT